MSIVAPVINDASLNNTTQSSQASDLQGSFMTLLTAQLQHQDPLDPMENTEFTTQLAEFSSLEQLESMNENLGYLQLYMASINNSQAMNFIGKEVVSSGNSIHFDGTNAANIDFRLNGDASNVNINIYDEYGTFVDNISYGKMDSGEQTSTWFGKDSNGNNMAAGNYTYEIYAADSDANKVGVSTYTSGVVDGITFVEGVGYVIIDDQQIPIGDILEIRERTETPVNNISENAYDLIGKDIVASGDKIYWDKETEPYVSYELAEEADTVEIRVYDSNGKKIRTFDGTGTEEGMIYSTWDGRIDGEDGEVGAVVPKGEYSFTVNAYDISGNVIDANTIIAGEVQGVTTENGSTYLTVAGLKIPASDVMEVKKEGSLFNFASDVAETISNTVSGISEIAVKVAPYLL